MRAMNVIALATLNRGKEEEFKELFAKQNLKLAAFGNFVRNASKLDFVESHEHGASYRENASLKCHAAYQAAKVPTLADDSGLEVDALKGEPGVHSAHYAKPAARESQDQANRRKLLDALKGQSNRKARMRCTLVFQMEGLMLQAEGVCEGRIADKESGEGGFGFDSIFIPDAGGGRNFAELSANEKNAISHRALAVQDLVRQMHERDLQLVRP